MRRSNFWLQLMVGWLPVWALYAALILTAHPGSTLHGALFSAFRAIAAAAVLGLLITRLTVRFPWPARITWPFVLLHLVAAPVFAIGWLAVTSLLESAVRGQLVIIAPVGIIPILILGVWFYSMVAGVTYAMQATARAARAEAVAARSQLSALRSQLNPHFLFNVLHTVVQLIPRDPRRAAQAAEELAALLRVTLREERDLMPLSEEWAFVQRYLAMEQLRFGDRLTVSAELGAETEAAEVPSFSLLTLVENAVRHGAGPKVEPTRLTITASAVAGGIALTVRDDGVGATTDAVEKTSGTGLRRLRERLAVLYGGGARLEIATSVGGGFAATQFIPSETLADR